MWAEYATLAALCSALAAMFYATRKGAVNPPLFYAAMIVFIVAGAVSMTP